MHPDGMTGTFTTRHRVLACTASACEWAAAAIFGSQTVDARALNNTHTARPRAHRRSGCRLVLSMRTFRRAEQRWLVNAGVRDTALRERGGRCLESWPMRLSGAEITPSARRCGCDGVRRLALACSAPPARPAGAGAGSETRGTNLRRDTNVCTRASQPKASAVAPGGVSTRHTGVT